MQCFCEWYRFACSFIAHLPPSLPTLIFLVQFFYLLCSLFFFSYVYFPLFECFLILLLLQCNVTTPQTRCLIVDERSFTPRPILPCWTRLRSSTILSTDESVQPLTTFPSVTSSERQLEFRSICILFYHLNAGVHTALNVPFCRPFATSSSPCLMLFTNLF